MLGGYLLVAAMMAAYMLCMFSATAYSTPTFVAVGSLFVTPVTWLWKVAEGKGSFLALPLVGLVLLLAALLLLIFSDALEAYLRPFVRAWGHECGCLKEEGMEPKYTEASRLFDKRLKQASFAPPADGSGRRRWP